MLEYLVHITNNSSQPIPFRIVRASYLFTDDIVVAHSSFLSNNDIDFITKSLEGRVRVVYASIKEGSLLFVNPYNANYFIYDSFTPETIDNIIQYLYTNPEEVEATNTEIIE